MGYARNYVEKTKKIAKKFVRYQEGAELYSHRVLQRMKQIIQLRVQQLHRQQLQWLKNRLRRSISQT